MERIRWAPKVQPIKIRRLYESDAKGLIDERLLDDVATAFYARCRSIVMVTEGRGICPDCQSDFRVNTACPGCGRKIDTAEFLTSYRHMDLYGGNGIDYFRSYVEIFPSVRDPREKMLLIDQLLHAFHRGTLAQAHRSVANNLIEGTHSEVVLLLDGLTFGENSATGGYRSEWQEKQEAKLVIHRAKPRDGD